MTSTFPSIENYSRLMRITEKDNPSMDSLIRKYYETRFEVEYRKFISRYEKSR